MKSFVQLQNDRFYKSLFEKMFFHKKHRLKKNVNSVKKSFLIFCKIWAFSKKL